MAKKEAQKLQSMEKLKLVDKVSVPIDTEERVTTTIYMDYGTAYGNVDTVMSRGNSFTIGYVVTVTTPDGGFRKCITGSSLPEQLHVRLQTGTRHPSGTAG